MTYFVVMATGEHLPTPDVLKANIANNNHGC